MLATLKSKLISWFEFMQKHTVAIIILADAIGVVCSCFIVSFDDIINTLSTT